MVLLLSTFTAWMGLANFYTGRIILGIVQLIILLLMIILIYLSHYYKRRCQIVDSIAIEPIILACMICITAWWVVDIATILNNVRIDGNGCPLNDDLF